MNTDMIFRPLVVGAFATRLQAEAKRNRQLSPCPALSNAEGFSKSFSYGYDNSGRKQYFSI